MADNQFLAKTSLYTLPVLKTEQSFAFVETESEFFLLAQPKFIQAFEMRISSNSSSLFIYQFTFVTLNFVGKTKSLDCRLSNICSDYSLWNKDVPPIANRVLDVCDALVHIDCQKDTESSAFFLSLVLSTISDELSSTEKKLLSSNSTPPGIVTLDHRQLFNSSSSRTGSSRLTSSIDLRKNHLKLPSDTCGQMFLVTLLWRSNETVSNSIILTKAWPFKVPCETGADLKLTVDLGTQTGKNLTRNLTLKIDELLVHQYAGFRMYLSNDNGSKATFLRRSHPSLPEIMAYITPRKHSVLTRGLLEEDAFKYRLGDVSLVGSSQLIRLGPDQTSPALKPGQKVELNPSALQLVSSAICGEAVMVFRLDVDDANVDNNFVAVPVFIDCWALPEFTEALGTCGVIPDEFALGSSALMYASLEPDVSLLPNSYLYKTEEKTFKPVRVSETMVDQKIRQFRMVTRERDRLLKRNQCPTNIELRVRFTETLFGQLQALINDVDQRWTHESNWINTSLSARSQQESIQLIGQALAGLLLASTSYNSVPAYFLDSVLNGLFTYWPFFPFEVTTQNYTIMLITNSSELSWHDRIAKVFTHFMRTAIYTDYDGQLNPDAGLQIFLNQLLWSPESLYSDTLTQNVTSKLRLVLLMVLEKQLPTTFDSFPSEIYTSLSNLSEGLWSPLPIKEALVRNTLEEILRTVRRLAKSSSDVKFSDSLIVLNSIVEVVNNPSSIRRLTLILQKIQENLSLNKQWIMMEGMSDTTLDADIYCRLQALIRLKFRENWEAEDLLTKLHRITFWKKDSGVIYRGDLSPITGRLYWNRVAVCNCDGYSRTRSYPGKEMP